LFSIGRYDTSRRGDHRRRGGDWLLVVGRQDLIEGAHAGCVESAALSPDLLTIYRTDPTLDASNRGAWMPPKSDLLQGTLDLLILRTLLPGAMHGWGISQRIQLISRDVLQVNQGSLYPALHRLEQQGLIQAEWGSSDNNRQAKFYELTRDGRRQLTEETRNWERLSTAVGRVLAGD
jgi:transcriptional regulator